MNIQQNGITSNINDLLLLLNNNQSHSTQNSSQNINILKTKKYPINNSLNNDSELNIPYTKKKSNAKINMNEIEEENDPFFKEYSVINMK